VVEVPIVLSFDYADFEDYWPSWSTGPARIAQRLRALPSELCTEIERHVRAGYLAGMPDGLRSLSARCGAPFHRRHKKMCLARIPIRLHHQLQSSLPALDETATGSLSWRKPGSIYPPAERWKGGPRLSAGEAFLPYRIPGPPCFSLAQRSNLVLPRLPDTRLLRRAMRASQ
jgi:hypothetical protein